MDKIDLLVMRYRDYLSACDALVSLDDSVVTGFVPSRLDRNECHVSESLLKELAKEAGSEVIREPYTETSYILHFRYDNIKFFALERAVNEP